MLKVPSTTSSCVVSSKDVFSTTMVIGETSSRDLATVAVETKTMVYAWALLPNHAHALVRSGPLGISNFMRRLLTGYAVYYNRRHGYLFQNRYKSILCEEEAYFRELIRYIHLNPLRAGLVCESGDVS